MLTLVLFFNAPFLGILLIPGFNWIMYAVGVIFNCLLQLFLHVQYTIYIVLGWGSWILVLVFNVAPAIVWLLLQWYEKFAFICQILFPGIMLAVWLLPLNMALSVSALSDEDKDQLELVYNLAVCAVTLKPTFIHIGLIGFRIAKDKYKKEYTGSG